MPLVTLDPTYEGELVLRTRAPGLASLSDMTVALLGNGKTNVREFLASIEERLRTDHGVRRVVQLSKSNMSAPAPPGVIEEAARCDALITAIGD